MFEQQVPLDPFENFNDDDDNNDDDKNDNDDNDDDNTTIANVMEIHCDGLLNVTHDIDHEEPQPSIAGSLSQIEKLVKDATEEATVGGIELLKHMQSMMTKVVADVRRIRVLQASHLSHPHAVFEVVENGDGNSVRRKKDWREQLLGSRKRKRIPSSSH